MRRKNRGYPNNAVSVDHCFRRGRISGNEFHGHTSRLLLFYGICGARAMAASFDIPWLRSSDYTSRSKRHDVVYAPQRTRSFGELGVDDSSGGLNEIFRGRWCVGMLIVLLQGPRHVRAGRDSEVAALIGVHTPEYVASIYGRRDIARVTAST